MDVASLVVSIIPIAQECYRISTYIVRFVQDRPLNKPHVTTRAKEVHARVNMLLHPIEKVAKYLGPEINQHAALQLTLVQDALDAAQSLLNRWNDPRANRSLSLRYLQDLAVITFQDGEKRLMKSFDHLDAIITRVTHDLEFIYTSERVAESLKRPEDLLPPQAADAPVPREINHAIRVLTARQLADAGKLVVEIIADEIGRDAIDNAIGEGFRFGNKVEGRFKACVFSGREYSDDEEYEAVLKDTKRIAALLHDPTAGDDASDNGLLRCLGYVQHGDEFSGSFDLVLKLPQHTQCNPRPRSLRDLLPDRSKVGHCTPQHPLDNRLAFAIQLARSVALVHSARIVHKNIRPESVLAVFDERDGPNTRYPRGLGTPYLLEFGQARATSTRTRRANFGDYPEVQLVYKHPRHLVEGHRDEWRILDDIYSLGVCLLEIGMWTSLFRESYEGSRYFVPNEKLIDTFEYDKHNNRRRKPFTQIKDSFVILAKEKVPPVMGARFSEVVVTCLEAWDESSLFGNDKDRNDDDHVTVKFHELVLDKLLKLSI